MTKIIPFKDNFDKAKKFDTYSNYALVISTAILIIAFFVNKKVVCFQQVSEWINRVNCLFILLYVGVEFMKDYYFFDASIQKREDFIDNSFGCSISGKKSQEYFTNDNIKAGIYKMCVNCFENVHFSYNIGYAMLTGIWVKAIFVSSIFIFLSICGYSEVVVLIIQLTLPLLLLLNAIKQTLFVNRLKNNLSSFKRLFNNMKRNERDDYIAEIICNVIEYEAILSWGGILFSSKLFSKMNTTLSQEWDSIKTLYDIKS